MIIFSLRLEIAIHLGLEVQFLNYNLCNNKCTWLGVGATEPIDAEKRPVVLEYI